MSSEASALDLVGITMQYTPNNTQATQQCLAFGPLYSSFVSGKRVMTDSTNPPGSRCGKCGNVNRATAKFCATCGAGLVAPVPESPVGDFYAQLSRLQSDMAVAFSLGELRDVAFGLGVADFASLPGETKEEKARELIWRMVREDRLRQLLAACRRERPNVAWPFVDQLAPAAASANPLDALFRQGIRHQLSGELADALQQFEGIGRIDPNYPGLQGKLLEIRHELGRGYVGPGGQVMADRVLHPPAQPSPQAGTGSLGPSPQPPTRGRHVQLIVIAVVVVLLALILIALWLAGQ